MKRSDKQSQIAVMHAHGRLTAPFSGRPQTLQHAGAQDLFEHNASSPAAKHFIDPGPLQRFVRRHATVTSCHCQTAAPLRSIESGLPKLHMPRSSASHRASAVPSPVSS